MEISIGISRAVRGNKEIRVVIVRCLLRYQFDLNRPLGKKSGTAGGLLRGLRCLASLNGFCHGSRASAGESWLFGCGFSGFFCLGSFDGCLIVSRRLPLFKCNCIGRACRQTVSKTVAVMFMHQFCFSIYHFNCALVARLGTEAAAIAEFFVDFDYFSDHHIPPCSFCLQETA